MYDAIIKKLKQLGTKRNRDRMARFGINTEKAFGISIAELRKIAKPLGKNRSLALKLWGSGWHEARILASMVDEPEKLTERQMDASVRKFDSWDLCDGVIQNLFKKSPLAYKKAYQWCESEKEFVKRAGFVMMAQLAGSDKKADDKTFIKMFPPIKKGALDERNFVKKAVNWAIRQIGKRNTALNKKAISLCKELLETGSKPAGWIARDALRELESPTVKGRIKGC